MPQEGQTHHLTQRHAARQPSVTYFNLAPGKQRSMGLSEERALAQHQISGEEGATLDIGRNIFLSTLTTYEQT